MKKYIWLEIFLLFLIGWSFYYVIINYSNLPDKIPIHFGPNGEPDGWTTKSLWSILVLPCVSIAMYLLLTISIVIVNKTQSLKFVNLPISRARIEILPKKEKQEILNVIIQSLLAIKCIITIMFLYFSYSTIQISIGKKEKLEFAWLFIAPLFIVIIWLTFKVYKLVHQAEKTIKVSRW